MKFAVSLALSLLVAGAAMLPAHAQFYRNFSGGTTQYGGGGAFGGGGAYGTGGTFGGGQPFGNGSIQLPGPLYSPYGGYGYGGGYGYNYGYGGYGYGAPAYPAPVAVPGLSAGFRFGKSGGVYWHAPSGYYYPWGIGSTTVVGPVYFYDQGATVQQKPPMSTMFTDMQKYLDDSKKEGRVADGDYQHLYRRLQDLRSKYDHLSSQADGGIIDPQDEDSIRRDAESLSGEIAHRVVPLGTTPQRTVAH